MPEGNTMVDSNLIQNPLSSVMTDSNGKPTMTSTQLCVVIVDDDGQPKYEKKHINAKIKDMFADKIDGQIIRPSLDSRGYVTDYNLPELEATMFVAKWDIAFLEQVVTFFINNKPQLSLLDTLAQGLAQMAELERKQNNQTSQLSAIAKRQDEMDGDTKFMTVLAYGRVNKLNLPLKEANKIGRKAAKFCKKEGILMGSVPDERWGTVKSYPVSVLDELFRGTYDPT